jgi:hypothetical protein
MWLPEDLITKIAEFAASTSFPKPESIRKHIDYEMFRLYIISTLYREHYVNHHIHERTKWDPNYMGIEIEWAQKILEEAKALNWDAFIDYSGRGRYRLRIYLPS